jgi:non-specific serine/threonine protein kinase/serine/threonine-protein kinase
MTMAQAEADPLPPISDAPFASAAGPDAPPTIAGYRVLGRLGRGGMGTVWRALQEGTRRLVALKILNTSAFGSAVAQARFAREVELTARLEHPNIARVYDSGVHHASYYYAMELIEGEALDTYVRLRHLPRREIVSLMRTVCAAVQHAHQRGVIHRDLKPSNILVTDDGRPHVLDFGLAKPAPEAGAGGDLSVDGEVSGTPAYMSPEQAAGRVSEIDTRSDVYSLGLVLYRLLVGKPPHDLSGSRYEVLRRIAEDEVRRPRDLNREVDRELEAVLLKALARHPDERYASAGELGSDLDNYLAGEPLAARAPSTAYFLRKRLRKYRVPLSVGALVAAALVALVVYTGVRIANERDRAREALASEQRALAELEASLEREQRAREALEARIFVERREYGKAETMYRRVLAERERKLGADHPETLAVRHDLAGVLSRERKYAEAERLLRRALEGRRRALGANHPDTLETAHDLAQTLSWGRTPDDGRLAEAERIARRTLARRRAAGDPSPTGLLASLRQLASILRQRGKFDECEKMSWLALDAATQAFGREHPTTLRWMVMLARTLQQQAKLEEAEDLWREAYDHMQATRGKTSPFTQYVMQNLISVLQARGNVEEAERLMAEQRKILEELRQTQHRTPLQGPEDDE